MRLLEPIKVGKIELKNRVMFPPMTTGYEGRDGTIVEQSFNFYKRLAEGGVSYIVLGECCSCKYNLTDTEAVP